MSIVAAKALQKKVDNLAREVATLRSLVIQIVRESDPEGEYKSSFVKSVLKAAQEKPVLEYEGKGSLLKQLRQLR